MPDSNPVYSKPSPNKAYADPHLGVNVDRLLKSLDRITEENTELNKSLESRLSEIKIIKKMLLNERMKGMELKQKVKFAEEESTNSGDDNSWLSFYADAITLILAFFVILYSMMTLDSAKFNVASDGIRQAFNSTESTSNLMATVESLEAELNDVSQKHGFVVNREGSTISVTIHVSGLFPLGKAELRNDQSDVLTEIAQKLTKHQKIRMFDVEIQGHTDDVPISNKRFRNNWELSALRATRTLEYLVKQGIDPKHAKASGYADTRPVPKLENESLKLHRAKNRRIEVIIMPSV